MKYIYICIYIYVYVYKQALFKGSNTIVCVLLVSNSRGCCLAVPGDHEGAARQHPREFDTNNTHTIMFDPDYNIMPPFFHSNQYSAH